MKEMMQQRKCTEHKQEIKDMAAEARDICRTQGYSQRGQSHSFKRERRIHGFRTKRTEAREWIASMA